MTEGHGDDLYKFGHGKIKYNFSSNVVTPPRNIVEGLHSHIVSKIDSIHNYPDPTCSHVERQIADILNISPANVCVTNGATEAIYLAAAYLKGRTTFIAEPTFNEYHDACQLNGHTFSKRFTSAIRSYWLCNPNNPTGEVRSVDSIRDLVGRYKEVTFVLDQSYAHFTKQKLMSAKEGRHFTNLIMIHSLTKHFAVPGLRIGYITGHQSIIKSLKQMRMPWSVNSLAQEAALYLLSTHFPDNWFDKILEQAHRLSEDLWEIGIPQSPTSTHFILCRTPLRTAADLKDWLIREKGILIRDASNFKGLSEQHFRVASQGVEADGKLCAAINEWLNMCKNGK